MSFGPASPKAVLTSMTTRPSVSSRTCGRTYGRRRQATATSTGRRSASSSAASLKPFAGGFSATRHLLREALGPREARVEAALGHELRVRAAGHDPAALEHEDQVGLLH